MRFDGLIGELWSSGAAPNMEEVKAKLEASCREVLQEMREIPGPEDSKKAFLKFADEFFTLLSNCVIDQMRLIEISMRAFNALAMRIDIIEERLDKVAPIKTEGVIH
jgi:hypothetical protein